MRINFKLALFVTFIIHCSVSHSQTYRNWEVGFHIQSSNRNTLHSPLVVNQQNIRWSDLNVGAQTTSLLVTATKVRNPIFQYGFQAGSITYGSGFSTFDVLPSIWYPSPQNLNLISVSRPYLLVGVHTRINVFQFLKSNVFRLEKLRQTDSRFKTFLQFSLGTTFRQKPFAGTLERMGLFPTFVNGPNGELGVLNRDFHDQAFFNGYFQGEIIAQYRLNKRVCLNARMFLHAPFGNPLFKFQNEYIYNNQLIGSATSYGPSSAAGFSFGVVYNIQGKRNKN